MRGARRAVQHERHYLFVHCMPAAFSLTACFFACTGCSNLTVYSLLLVFSVLLSLRVEGVICWSYGAVFLPLWVWKFLVAVGTVAGIVGWARKRKRLESVELNGVQRSIPPF